jgi:hypothetical protein
MKAIVILIILGLLVSAKGAPIQSGNNATLRGDGDFWFYQPLLLQANGSTSDSNNCLFEKKLLSWQNVSKAGLMTVLIMVGLALSIQICRSNCCRRKEGAREIPTQVALMNEDPIQLDPVPYGTVEEQLADEYTPSKKPTPRGHRRTESVCQDFDARTLQRRSGSRQSLSRK